MKCTITRTVMQVFEDAIEVIDIEAARNNANLAKTLIASHETVDVARSESK